MCIGRRGTAPRDALTAIPVGGSGEGGDADGMGDAAEFCCPRGIAISPDGSALFVADCGLNHKIRQVGMATGAVTTLAGSGIRDQGEKEGEGQIVVGRQLSDPDLCYWGSRSRGCRSGDCSHSVIRR